MSGNSASVKFEEEDEVNIDTKSVNPSQNSLKNKSRDYYQDPKSAITHKTNIQSISASNLYGPNSDMSDTFREFQIYERNKENVNNQNDCVNSISWKLSHSNPNLPSSSK